VSADAPLLRVVKGDPSPEELAALVAVLAARSSAPTGAGSARGMAQWADRAAGLRRPLAHGPHAWRASGLPR
jgi:hypothetical protein